MFWTKSKTLGAALAVMALFSLTGCGEKQAAKPQNVKVKTMQVVVRDTPLVFEYSGFVEAQNDVEIKSKVTGTIVKKLVQGGQSVKEGQVLFVVDPRNYKNAVLKAQADLASSQASLANVERDMTRYEYLYKQGAVSKQTLDQTSMQLSQAEAAVAANQSLLESAQVDLTETEIKAPFTGRVDTNVVADGTFVTSNSTVLTSLSNSNPMRVKISLSEQDYLYIVKNVNKAKGETVSDLHLKLSDGTEYPLKGKITEVDRGIGKGTGTLTLKATFENPDGILLPGMFAHVYATTDTVKGAKLIPQRAVKEMLYKKFVFVVGEDKKVTMKEVELGNRVGRMWMVEKGLEGTETIVVEGIQKLSNGVTVEGAAITEADLETKDKK